MGLITYTDTISGTLNGVTHTVSGTYSRTVKNAILHDHDVATAWKIVTQAIIVPSIVVLINIGAEDAEYRVLRGINYFIFNLPAGKKVIVHNDAKYILGSSGAFGGVFVRSTNGTTVQVIVAY